MEQEKQITNVSEKKKKFVCAADSVWITGVLKQVMKEGSRTPQEVTRYAFLYSTNTRMLAPYFTLRQLQWSSSPCVLLYHG
jgi:hypothetical protein